MFVVVCFAYVSVHDPRASGGRRPGGPRSSENYSSRKIDEIYVENLEQPSQGSLDRRSE